MKSFILSIAALLCGSSALIAQTPVGAFFAFQDAASQSAANGSGTYSTAVNVENFPGIPTFSGTGLIAAGLGSFANNFTAYDSSVWTGAKCAGWNAKTTANRTWQITFNSTGVENLTTRFNYRLNGVTTNGGTPVTALAAFDYKVGSGAWVAVPGAALALTNNTSYNNEWTANLSSVSAINNQTEVTLRWSFPAFDTTSSDTFVRLDNLQITGIFNTSPPALAWVTASQLVKARVDSSYSRNLVVSGGTAPYTYAVKSGSILPAGLSLGSGGNLTGTPTSAGSYQFTITATDSSAPPITSDRQFSLEVSRARALPEGNYNVLFVAFDDLKANFGPFLTPELAAAMPKPVTPHLESLSSTGMAFTRAYCQQAVCWASRASLMTGCRPDTTKIWDQNEAQAFDFRDTMPGIITLPQHFANRGYNVAGYGKIYDYRGTPSNLDESRSWPGGMNVFSSPRNFYEDGHWQAEQSAPSNSKSKLFATDMGETNHWVTPSRPVNKNTDYADGIMTTNAITKLNTYAGNYTSSNKPFFLAVGYVKPHLPFTAPKQFWDLYDPAQINLTDYTGTRTFPTGTLPFTGSNFEISSYGDIGTNTVTDPNEARRLIHGYLAATSFVDDQLGRVLAALNANPTVAANTIIVVWGDHGWHLGDHNGFWAKHSCYENAARSPLIFRAPGMAALGTAGKTCQSPVEFVDIYPTLVDLASQPSPAQPAGLEMQGKSLLPLLEDPEQPWKKAAFTQYQRNINGSGITNSGNGMGYSIRTSRYRYTEWWRTQSTIDANGNSSDRHIKLFTAPEYRELYDMINDPNETVNLAANPTHASTVTELTAALAGGNGWETTAVSPPANFPTDFPTWQANHVEPGYPIGLLAEAMDPDGDGLMNLREYAHGTNPFSPNADPAWSEVTGTPGAQFLSLVFPMVGSRTDVTTSATTSAQLSGWTTTGVINENLGQQANRTWWRSKISMSGAAPAKGFLRLEIEN